MSHTIQDEVIEMHDSIQRAIASDDDTQLMRLSDLAAEADDMELAGTLRGLAKVAHRNNWAYDEAKDNQM